MLEAVERIGLFRRGENALYDCNWPLQVDSCTTVNQIQWP